MQYVAKMFNIKLYLYEMYTLLNYPLNSSTVLFPLLVISVNLIFLYVFITIPVYTIMLFNEMKNNCQSTESNIF